VTALTDIAHASRLRTAWSAVSKTGKNRSRDRLHDAHFLESSSGLDYETVASFRVRLDENLKAISSQLKSREYGFSPLRPVIVPKRDGKSRVICVPSVRDRIVQKVLLDFLCSKDVDRCRVKNSVSFGFVPGRGVKQAAQRAAALRNKKPWAYKADIQAFFDTLPRGRLEAELRRIVRHRTLHDLLIAAVHCEVSPQTAEQARELIAQGICEGVGVRQGMPLSPLFSNIVLRGFDAQIEKANLSMVRYADDLIIFASSRSQCEEVHEIVKAALEPLGLHVHEPGPETTKTVIYEPAAPAEFLGVAVELNNGIYCTRISKGQLEHLKRQVGRYAKPEFLEEQNLTLRRLVSAVDGTIAGYQGAYDFCENAAQAFEAMWDKRQQVIAAAMKNVLGIDVSQLDERGRWFLEYETHRR
jgi:RNA-directed DNA polymerase